MKRTAAELCSAVSLCLSVPLCLFTLSSHGAAQQLEPEISFVQLPDKALIVESIRADFNGDDRIDLLLAWSPEDSPARFVQWHFQAAAKPAFRSQPERPAVRLDRAVLGVALGDVLSDTGSELIVFTSSVVWAVRFDATDEAQYVRLFGTHFLWQGVESSEVFGWQQGVRDIDGDGLVDVLVPEPDGYRIALQRRDAKGAASFETQSVLTLPRVPPRPMTQRRRRGMGSGRDSDSDRFEAAFALDDRPSGPLLRVVDSVPVPKLGDWDADGDLDLFCLHGDRLLVWLQSNSFTTAPVLDFELPRQPGLVDTVWRVMEVDVDHDQRVDIAIHSSRMVEEETRVSIEIYRNPGGDPFTGKKRPDDKIRLKGLVGFAHYEDIDGDHLPEFVVGTLNPGLIDAVSGGSFRGVLNVFKNDFDKERARFRRPVALAFDVEVPTADLGERGNFKSHFFADVTGDGVCDLLQRTEDEVVRIYGMTRSGSGFALGDAVYSLGISAHADVETVVGSPRKEFFVLENAQVIHVRFE